MTLREWTVFTDNGIRELRTRFEEFASGMTPRPVIENFIAYLGRETNRVNAIEPDSCWAELHAAYLAVVLNDKAMLVAVLEGDDAQAQARYDATGQLNHDFSQLQDAVALNCR